MTIEWETFGRVEGIDIYLSSDGGVTFPITIGNDIDKNQSPLKYSLQGLGGYNYVVQLKDTLTDGFTAQSGAFMIISTDTTTIENITCDPNQINTTFQTLTNQFGCDSIIATNTVLDNIVPTAICHNNVQVYIDVNGVSQLTPSTVSYTHLTLPTICSV